MTPVLAGVARGDAEAPQTTSGATVTRYLFAALARRYPLAGQVDVELHSWQRPLVALLTIHPARAQWRERFYKNGLAFRLQSRNSGVALARLDARPDLAIQLFSLFQTRGAPYAVSVDMTHHLSRQEWPPGSPFGRRALRRWYDLEGRAYREALHVFAWSQPVAESLVSFYGVPPERVSVVGAGVNFDPLPEPVTPSDRPMILFVGREWRRKGGDRLIEAFRGVRRDRPDARLQIVGTTEARDEPGVEVLGTVADRQQLAELYAGARVFCLPSRFEPYATALMEAMAHGLPCVTTRTGGLAEIVEDGRTGLVVPPDDADALADALGELLDNPARAVALGRAGRERVERVLNWDLVVDRMAGVIDRLAPGERLDHG